MMICENLSVRNGHLHFAGQDTVMLARRFGTPVYLMDEDRIRANCRAFRDAAMEFFGPQARVLYASKANSFKAIYPVIQQEGLGIDVVSCGEIYTAQAAGFDLSNAFFHSNNKTDEDIAFAMDCGVGYFVSDNVEEVRAIEREAASRGIRQKILLRLTPGVDPHTYEAVATGKVDSKFGTPIETGQALEIVKLALSEPHIGLAGYHCHVGSQVFGEDVFERTAEIMLAFSANVRDLLGFEAPVLDMGGGFGVRYTQDDPPLDIRKKIGSLAAAVNRSCEKYGLRLPQMCIEPGRSIAADAGLTLYTAGTVKRIPGYKNYVSVDGGMADAPRYALYKSRYTVLCAGKMNEACDFKASVVGRCCESGDILQENVMLPSSVGRGDIIALCTTGAYHYSMSSNYNRLTRPATVMLSGGESRVVVRAETLDDLIRNDL